MRESASAYDEDQHAVKLVRQLGGAQVKIFNRGLMEQKARRSLSMVQRDALQVLLSAQ